jgi:hypothetical protein
VHLTPTSSSWLNQVERVFALLTDRQLRGGVHHSVAVLKTAITAFIETHNADPKPFRWQNPPTTSWLQSNASACTTLRPKPNLNAANFRFRTLEQSP